MIKILFLDLEFDLCSADPHWCNDPGSLQVLFAALEMRHPAHTFTYNGSLLYAILSDGKELGVFLGMSDSLYWLSYDRRWQIQSPDFQTQIVAAWLQENPLGELTENDRFLGSVSAEVDWTDLE